MKKFLKSIPFNSIRFKISVLYTVVLGLILIMFSTVLYFIIAFYLFKDIDNNLKLKVKETLANISLYRQGVGDRPGALEFAVRRTFFYETDDFPLRLTESGRIRNLETRWSERAQGLGLASNYEIFLFSDTSVIKSKNVPLKLLPELVKKVQAANRKDVVFENFAWGRTVLRIVTVPYRDSQGNAHILLISALQNGAEQLLGKMLQAAVLGIPLVLVLTSFIGFILVQRILDPIEEIARTANQITYKDLNSRVKARHLDAEIEYVVASFNDMISRLEKSFQHINEFSSQVAHELKTPLAIIRGEAELALSQDRTKEEYKDILRINLEETNRMRKTVEDLLLLTRLDFQPGTLRFQAFEFSEFFQEVYEQAQMWAAEKGLEVEASIPEAKVMVQADKLHLRRMLLNIIDNALKFTLPPGKVTLEVVYYKKEVRLTVADTGVGIVEAELPKIFDRFYHFDRTGKNDGACTGLGLSIVQSIVRSHQGSIQVASKINAGTTMNLNLPIVVEN